MPEQPQRQPVIGEDGELLQPDTTVNPNAYNEFLATHVHRDPLLYRVREHFRDNGCIYLFVTLALGCMACGFFQGALADRENIFSLFIFICVVVAAAVLFVYVILQTTDTRQ